MNGTGNSTDGLDGSLNTNTSTLSMEFRTYTNGFG
jgi:hypothetical protein